MDKEKIRKALIELKSCLLAHFGKNIEMFLFGSVARDNYEEFSDIDVLVLLPCKVNNSLKEEIFDEAFEIGLKYDVIFGIIVYSKDFWMSEKAKVMPLYINIQKESIRI